MNFDLAIVGSGFGGSLLAMIARRLGRSVVLLERGAHPRFAIGESSTPLANLLLEELSRRYELPRLLPLAKWGTWQRAYPGIACGLKRGFTFCHHTFDAPWRDSPEHPNQLLVAASPHDGIADTHWYRPEFDHFLVREAQAQGVEYLDRVRLDEPTFSVTGVTLHGEREGHALSWNARFLVDATGPRGFLHHALSLQEQAFSNLPPTEALYTHFTGVRRLGDICRSADAPPYPIDDAAVHHVFEGGWIWALRFNNGITSAGVAATAPLARQLRLEEGAPAWQWLLDRLPAVGEQFAEAKAQLPFIRIPQLSFRSRTAAGPSWAMLPSAAGFVDPLLSTGFPLTLLGITRLAEIIEQDWHSDRFNERLLAYSQQTLKELDTAAQLVGALYANMRDFSVFSALSLLYFAAASFTETARHLGRPELAGPSFLLADHATFGPQFHDCCRAAQAPVQAANKDRLIAQVHQAITPIDVAGLGDSTRRNWFPVEARDLLRAAPKLGVDETAIHQLLARCGFDSEAGGRI